VVIGEVAISCDNSQFWGGDLCKILENMAGEFFIQLIFIWANTCQEETYSRRTGRIRSKRIGEVDLTLGLNPAN